MAMADVDRKVAEGAFAEAERRIKSARTHGSPLLDCSGLRLTSIPDSLALLPDLEYLDLSYNRISAVPNSLASLVNLEVLHLANNQVTATPDSLASLCSLQTLYLRGNQISAIPDSLASLRNLQTLSLYKNKITVIPDSLASLPNLEYLDLSSNKITAIPESLASLTKLQKLDLSDNKITAIPESLAQLPENLKLGLSRNRFPGELAEVVNLGWPRLRAYLKERAQKAARQWRVKLLLVGEGGVGKTNLLRRLKGEEFVPKLDPTHSLEIRDLKLAHPSEAGVELDFRAWDFGGQDFYHATHQFFYSGKSVFLLVWNSRENIQQGKLTSWLDRIQALAPESPVLLVATWTDKVQPNIPLAELKEKYPQVLDLYRVDNESGNRIDGLKKALQDVAITLDHVGQSRPASWIKATEAIRQQSEPYAEFSAFQRLAESKGVTEFDTFAEYLGRTGEITFFPRNPIYQKEMAELRDWVILKPDWLLQQVSCLLTDKEVATQRGVVTAVEQQRIWKDSPNLVQDYLLA
jgi:internalin A